MTIAARRRRRGRASDAAGCDPGPVLNRQIPMWPLERRLSCRMGLARDMRSGRIVSIPVFRGFCGPVGVLAPVFQQPRCLSQAPGGAVKPLHSLTWAGVVKKRIGGPSASVTAPLHPIPLRLKTVFGGPYSRSSSQGSKPSRSRKTMPFLARRSSMRILPWILGQDDSGRVICASFSEKRSLFDWTGCRG